MLGFLNSKYPLYPKDKELSIYCMNSTKDSIQKIVNNYEKKKDRVVRFKSFLTFNNDDTSMNNKNNKNNNTNESYNGELIQALNQGQHLLITSLTALLYFHSFTILKLLIKH